jgi:hypothetical protein
VKEIGKMKAFALTLALFAAAVLHAESRADLEKDIAALKMQIAQKRPAVETLSQPWRRGSALDFGFSATPFIALIREINMLPEAQRRIDFAVTAVNGQLSGWDADCVVLGHKYSEEGEFVEFNDPNYRVEANAKLSNFDAAWVAGQGLRFGIDGSAHLGIGMIKWHRKFCVGDVTAYGGPATCDASARLSSLTSMSLSNNVLQYASAINLNDINYGCSISFGSLGDLTIPQLFKVPANVAFNGSMPLPVSTAGVLQSADPRLPIRKVYDIRLVNPTLTLTNEGVDVGTDIAIVWR